MRYLTVTSFMKQNPDWRVMLWLPAKRCTKKTWTTKENGYRVACDDFYPKLLELDVDTMEVDFEGFGFSNTMSEVHKSDYLRLYLLSTMGGLWTDMDVLYFKPMASLVFNVPKHRDKDTFVCMNKHSEYIHSAGFLMSAPGSSYFKCLDELSRKHYNESEYQCIGTTMYNKYFRSFNDVLAISNAINIPMDVVYAHDANHVRDLAEGMRPLYTDNSIGAHWYAGHHIWEKFILRTNGGQINLPETVIGQTIKRAR